MNGSHNIKKIRCVHEVVRISISTATIDPMHLSYAHYVGAITYSPKPCSAHMDCTLVYNADAVHVVDG